MPQASCKICKKKFYVKPSHLLRGWGKYCSKACQSQSQKRGKFVSCAMCGEKVWRIPKELRHSKSGKSFCGKKCQTLWRNSVLYVGPNHINWKGGEFAYRRIMQASDAPLFCKRCKIKDKRLLAVHHLDMNRKNNGLKNLVWLCHNCHFLIHHSAKEKEKFHNFKKYGARSSI